MPKPDRLSLNAAEILSALSALAGAPDPEAPAPDSRWVLASALALRRTELPGVRTFPAAGAAAASGESPPEPLALGRPRGAETDGASPRRRGPSGGTGIGDLGPAGREPAAGGGARILPFPGGGRSPSGAAAPAGAPPVPGRTRGEEGAGRRRPELVRAGERPGQERGPASRRTARAAGLAEGNRDPSRQEAGSLRTPGGDTLRLVPAPGTVPGVDEGRSGLTVFRSLDGGTVLGRVVPVGARILASRREPDLGDLAVFATRKTLGLCPAGAPPPGARILAVVEAVIAR